MIEPKRKRGRPAKISSDDIARAVLDIGIDKASVRTVAEKLGVSAAGIYHHVANSDDLLDLAMSRQLSTLLPRISDKDTFEQILLSAAQAYYEAILDFPMMLSRTVGGQLNTRGTALYYEALIAAGASRGFTEFEAFYAVRCVLLSATGAAAANASTSQDARTRFSETLTVGVAALAAGTTPHVRALLGNQNIDSVDELENVRLTLAGLERKFGERMNRTV